MTISDLLASVLPRLTTKPQCSVIEATRRAQSIITNRLFLKRSNLVKDTVSTSISSGSDYVTLSAPSGKTLLNMAGDPFYPDRKFLTVYDSALSISDTAQKPKYYEKIGRKLYLYPLPDADYDLTIPVFAAPAAPSAMEDELPFDGLFDDVFAEAVFGVMLNGTSAVADRAFTAAIDSQVDQVLLAQDMADEQNLVDSINYR